MLIAASPIQVVVGSFISEIEKTPAEVGNGQQSSVGYSPTAAPPPALTPASAPRSVKTIPASVIPAHQQPANITPPTIYQAGNQVNRRFINRWASSNNQWGPGQILLLERLGVLMSISPCQVDDLEVVRRGFRVLEIGV